MAANGLWEKSLEGADYQKISEFAATAPVILTEASTGDSTKYVRDTGLILTKQQVISLRKYEAAALALPHTQDDVAGYLNFGLDTGSSGLKVSDFLSLFLYTREHAKRWSPLRERIMLTGTELKLFGASMEVNGQSIEEVYKEVRAAKTLDNHDIKTLGDLKKFEREWGYMPGLELEPDTIPDMKYYLDKIFEKVRYNLSSVDRIKADLAEFDSDLRLRVIPGIKVKMQLIKSQSYPDEIQALEQLISRRADEIEELNALYKSYVKQSLESAAEISVSGLGMAIYLGVEAENVRSERKILNEKQNQDIEKLSKKNQTLGSMKRVEHDLQNLDLITLEAEVATRNLVFVWNTLHRYVAESEMALTYITDALGLRRFMTAFREVVHPWIKIQSDADALIKVFREADEEYYRDRIMSSGKIARMFTAPDYPELNTRLLQGASSEMINICAEAEALFIKFNYLPSLFDRFKRIVTDVNACTTSLRESSIDCKVELETRVRRLLTLQRELSGSAADPEEIAEIEEDLENELNDLVRTQNAAALITNRLANIDEPFERSVTLGYVSGLELDQRNASGAKESLGMKVTELEGALRASLDAVSLIENAVAEKKQDISDLTPENLLSLGMAPPQIKAVMLAVELLKKSIGSIAPVITFVSMVEGSRALRSRINDVHDRIAREDEKIRVLKGKARFVQVVHSLDDQRLIYIAEYKQADAAFWKFLGFVQNNLSGNIESRCGRFINEAKKFIGFLAIIERP